MLLDPIRSIVDFSFYRTVREKSFAATVGYLCYLGLLFAFAVALAMYIHVRPVIAEAVEWASTQIPTMTLAGGKLSSALPEPTVIRHPKVPEAAFVIDTNRAVPVSAAEMAEKKVIGYLSQNAIYVLTRNRMETYPLDKAPNPKPITIDANFYRTLGQNLNRMLYPVAFVIAWLFFLVWKHIAALFYSLPALVINAVQSAGLEFPALYKSAVYAQTPVVVLQMAAMFYSRPVPFFNVVSFIVVTGYLWKAVRLQKAEGGAPAV